MMLGADGKLDPAEDVQVVEDQRPVLGSLRLLQDWGLSARGA